MVEAQEEQTLGTVVDTLANEPKQTTLRDGTVLHVSKVKMRHIAAMAGIVNNLVAQLGVDASGNVTVNLHNPEVLLQLISKLPDDIASVVTMLTNLTMEQYEGLDIDEGLEVVQQIIKENRAFFTEKVLPKLTSLMAGVTASGGGLKSHVSKAR